MAKSKADRFDEQSAVGDKTPTSTQKTSGLLDALDLLLWNCKRQAKLKVVR